MKKMIWKKYVIFFITSFSLCYAGRPDFQLKYTLQRDQIDHAGLVRLSDIFSLIDESDYYSIDGFTWQTTLKDFDLNQQQNWILIINDQTIETKIFDKNQINLLPYSTDHIDSIEVFVYPQLIHYEFADKGIIHLHLRNIENGITLQGQFTAGNKTGDPGPYRYTEYWSANIDRIAADKSYWLAYSDSSFQIGFGYYDQIFYPTDKRMVERLRDIYTEHNPYTENQSYSFMAGFKTLFSHPQIQIFRTTMKDFYFFKPAGREIPTNQNITFAALSGGIDISTGLDLNYKFYYQNHNLDKRPNTYQYDFDWGTEKIGGDIRTGFFSKVSQSDFGFGIKQMRANTGYVLSNNILNIGKVYGSYKYKGLSNHRPGFYGMLEFGDAGRVIKLSFSDQYQVSTPLSLTGVLSYSETSILEENTLWYWSDRGYNFINDIGGSYDAEGVLSPANRWSFDFSMNRVEDKWPGIEVGFSLRRFLSKNWEVQPLTYEPEDKTVSGPVLIKTQISSHRGRFFLKIDYRGSNPLMHHLYYHYSTTSESSSMVRNLWESVPEHKFIYRITYTPVESFSIWSMLHYHSSVFWYDFKNVEKESEGDYSAYLSEVLSLDLAINKWLWHKQIKVDVVLSNVFNRENIYFPIGASLDLRFYAQAELYFNFM